MTARLPDWETRLSAYLANASAEVGEAREFYCGLFPAGAVEAVTGENPARELQGRLGTAAKRLSAIADRLFLQVPVGLAQRGDLAWYENTLGVVIGGDALFVTAGPDPELQRVPRALWQKAWSVGRGRNP